MPESGPISDATARWREALLAEADLSLAALSEQYLGRSAKGQDKTVIVSALSAFLSLEETKAAASGLLERMDSLIAGTLLVSGSLTPEALGRLLAADMAYYELEYRLANLQERLIVFMAKTGEYEVAPQLAASLAETVDSQMLFGPEGESEPGLGESFRGKPSTSIQVLCILACALLREGPDPVLKSGILSARARKKILELSGGDEGAPEILSTILDAFVRLKLANSSEAGWSIDQRAAARFLVSAGADLPYILAVALAGGGPAGMGNTLKAAFEPFLRERFIFSESGLTRFAALAIQREGSSQAGQGERASALKLALLGLGLVAPVGEDAPYRFICRPEKAEIRWSAEPEDLGRGRIVIDGSGGIQVLPTASLGDLAFLIEAASLNSAFGGWRFRLRRESARRAFSEGWTVEGLSVEFERMSGHPLPQTLTWDLGSWRTEYDSVRLFKGQILALGKPAADLVEKSGAFAKIPHEVLGNGFYFFGQTHSKIIEEALLSVGLPPPSQRGGMKGEQGNFARHHDEGPSHEDSRHREGASLSFKAQAKPQSPEADLREYLTDLLHEPALRRNYEEMFERRLVYNKNQLRAMVEREASFLAKGAGRGPARAEALSASGLDFNGKLRVIQAAFKTKFSRLDAKWSSGGQNLAALVRPVSLRKTERDYELEGENLSTGRPVTIRVGSMTYVGLKKGYYLGEK